MYPITETQNKHAIDLTEKAPNSYKLFPALLTLPLVLGSCLTTITADTVMAEDRSFYEQQLKNPAVQKLLKTIRVAEGTERGGPASYRVMFGGKLAQDLSRHPDRAITGGGYTSTAAGAYQFLTPTWQSAAKKLGLKTFGQQEQDIAGAYLAHQRLKPIGGFARLEKEGLSPEVAAALAPEWASFPTQSGASYYGQPVKSLKKLQQVFGQDVPAAAPMQPQIAGQSPNATIIVVDQEAEQQPLKDDFARMYAQRLMDSGYVGRSKIGQAFLQNMLGSIAGTSEAPRYFGEESA